MSSRYRPYALLIRGLLCVLLMSLRAVVEASTLPSEEALVGTWYGEVGAANQIVSQRFLLILDKDGTFATKVRMYDRGRAQGDVNNSGLWGFSNGLFFTFTLLIDGQKVDPKWPRVSNPYLVRSITPGSFEYQHIPSGNNFLVKRVVAGFAMPN